MKICHALLIAIFVSSATLAEDGTIVRSSKLFKSPSFSADLVEKLEIGAEVEATQRKGGWKKVNIKQNGRSGWIRAYTMRPGVSGAQVKKATLTSSESSGGLASIGRSITSLFGSNTTRNENEGNLTTTVGIRGLSAEQIESAKPDPAAADKMIAYQVSPDQSQSFAKQVELEKNSLKHIKIKQKKNGAGGANEK